MNRGGDTPVQKTYIALNISPWTAGYLENENVYLYGFTSSGNIIACSADGLVYDGPGANLTDGLKTSMRGKLENAGIQFNEFIVIETPYTGGETIENWENYRKIS